MAGFAPDVLGVVAMGLDAGVVRSGEMAVRIAATNPTNRTMGARWSFIGRGRPRPWMDPWIGNRWRRGDNARGEWG
jgi:hypothetical protein